MSGEVLATGTVASEGTVTGKLAAIHTIDDVIRLMKEDLDNSILLTEHASVTSVVPILPRVRAVVCMGGGVTSHIAIVSRQLGLPCVVAAKFAGEPDEADGMEVQIDAAGCVRAVADS